MSSRTAPRAATWLLERVGGRSQFDPLIGDLVEQFEDGKSRLWYWRQAVGTVAIDLTRTLRLHALSFIAAIAAGCALVWLLDAGYPFALRHLHAGLSAADQHPWSFGAVLRVAGMVMCDLMIDALTLIIVWLVTRMYRPHPRAVLSFFAAAVTVRYVPGIAQVLIHAATDPQLTAPLLSRHLHLMAPVAWQALYILAGGLWLVRRPGLDGMNRAIHGVAVIAATLCVLAALARAAGLVGVFSATLHAQYVFDMLNIGSVACLVLLLWRPARAAGMSAIAR